MSTFARFLAACQHLAMPYMVRSIVSCSVCAECRERLLLLDESVALCIQISDFLFDVTQALPVFGFRVSFGLLGLGRFGCWLRLRPFRFHCRLVREVLRCVLAAFACGLTFACGGLGFSFRCRFFNFWRGLRLRLRICGGRWICGGCCRCLALDVCDGRFNYRCG